MELAATAWTALTAAVTAAPATAATATAGSVLSASAAAVPLGTTAAATSAAAAGSGLLSGVQGALTISSAVASLFAGVAGYQSHKSQAAFADLDAEAARLAGEAEAIKVRRELVQRVGDTRVAFAGAGLDISSGAAIEDSLASQAEFEIGNTRDAARMSAGGRAAQASSLRSQGQAALVSGVGRAGERVVDYGLDLRRRG